MYLVKSLHSYYALEGEHVPAHIVATTRDEIRIHHKSVSSALGGGCSLSLKWHGQWVAAGYHFFPMLCN